MIVPYEMLSEEALDGVMEEFILREGTDYGHRDWTMAEKKNMVLKQLTSKRAQIVFDSQTESCSIILSEN
jgi:uncharacterized protein